MSPKWPALKKTDEELRERSWHCFIVFSISTSIPPSKTELRAKTHCYGLAADESGGSKLFPHSPTLHTCMFAMGASPRAFSTSRSSLFACLLLMLLHVAYAGANGSDTMTIQRDYIKSPFFYDCDRCNGWKEQRGSFSGADVGNSRKEDIDIVATYSDTSGAIRLGIVKMKDLSSSWVWENRADRNHGKMKKFPLSSHNNLSMQTTPSNQSGIKSEGGIQNQHSSSFSPVKLKRWMLRQERGKRRTAELILQDKEKDEQMVTAAIERAKSLDTTAKGKYSIWRRDYENPNSDSTLRLMRDQIIMAKAYATIAKSKNMNDLYNSLIAQSRKNQHIIGEATTDIDLNPSALDQAKAMGHMLSLAKDQLYDCLVIARKLRAMLQATEENVNAAKKMSAYLIQLAAKTVPRQLHCLSLRLEVDYYYYFQGREIMDAGNKKKIEDPSLYHYSIFSDNVLATSVVVNSTVQHAHEPEKHVFHIVTDKLNFAAMKMWFLVNSPANATIHVENIDSFKWLNSSYCSVLRQLESARIKEYYFKANQASSLSAGADHLKYRNPKYLSMLNHLRFYLPEVYPKLDKILFLDDDIVVQKDLTPLWSVDLQGMVNGAVETCKESFHRFDKYLNFSNPKISDNFDPNACGWAFGMNIFDLKEWKKRNITGIYHRWQDMNEDRTLWKLGTLPPGLITFYNLTYPLDRRWHVLGLGYDPALNQTEIENGAVIHYNGNYKPWLDLAVSKYRPYWSKHIKFENPYFRSCNINE